MSRMMVRLLVLTVLLALPGFAAGQDAPVPPPTPVKRIDVLDTTVFTAEDVQWMLQLRRGAPLPGNADDIASRLQKLYAKEGYTLARVTGEFDAATGVLTLRVDEGRVDEIDFVGATPALERRFRDALTTAGVEAGAPFNAVAARRALSRVVARTNGAFRLDADAIELVVRGTRRAAVVPVRQRPGDFSLTTGSDGREEIYNYVDGFSPSIGFHGVAYDRSGFNYTFVSGFSSWKFGRDSAGFSLGVERPLLSDTRAFVGVEMHDLTATDDAWRVSSAEQTLGNLLAASSFRDYYRRRGLQVHAGFRPSSRQEFVASMRWDRHEALGNSTDFTVFRRSHTRRPNPVVADAELNALVLAYTLDSRGLDDAIAERYERHLVDDLFRGVRRGRAGWRLDWTAEIAGRGFGGEHEFTRSILNARAVTRIAPHQSLAIRGLFGWSTGTLPLERELSLGGAGSVHGYAFKEATGRGLTLFNAEYAFDIEGNEPARPGVLRALLFFDAGRVKDPLRGRGDWMRGVGVGLQTGPLRFEWGFKASDLSGSQEFAIRLGRSF